MDLVNPYFAVLLALVLAFFIAVAGSIVSSFLGPRRKNSSKEEVMECGVPPVGHARQLLSIKFYLTAILFILFDIETVFMFLWAAAFDYLGWFGVVEVGIFVAILVAGFVYILKRGALSWENQ